MSRLRRLAGWGCAAGMAIALIAASALAQPRGRNAPPPADDPPPPQGVSRGENFSAKPAAQLFNADCTGAGCHRGPQGLAKGQSALGLTSFLRQHYTNSQQSAAALAAYLAGVPGDARPAARQKADTRTRPEPDAPKTAETRRPATAARPPRGKQATVEPAHVPPPEPPAAAPPPPPPPKTFDIFD